MENTPLHVQLETLTSHPLVPLLVSSPLAMALSLVLQNYLVCLSTRVRLQGVLWHRRVMSHRETSLVKLYPMSRCMSGDIGQSEITSSQLSGTPTRDLVQAVILLLTKADYEIVEKTAHMCFALSWFDFPHLCSFLRDGYFEDLSRRPGTRGKGAR